MLRYITNHVLLQYNTEQLHAIKSNEIWLNTNSNMIRFVLLSIDKEQNYRCLLADKPRYYFLTASVTSEVNSVSAWTKSNTWFCRF